MSHFKQKKKTKTNTHTKKKKKGGTSFFRSQNSSKKQLKKRRINSCATETDSYTHTQKRIKHTRTHKHTRNHYFNNNNNDSKENSTQIEDAMRQLHQKKKNGCERVVQQDEDGETQYHKHGKTEKVKHTITKKRCKQPQFPIIKKRKKKKDNWLFQLNCSLTPSPSSTRTSPYPDSTRL